MDVEDTLLLLDQESMDVVASGDTLLKGKFVFTQDILRQCLL